MLTYHVISLFSWMSLTSSVLPAPRFSELTFPGRINFHSCTRVAVFWFPVVTVTYYANLMTYNNKNSLSHSSGCSSVKSRWQRNRDPSRGSRGENPLIVTFRVWWPSFFLDGGCTTPLPPFSRYHLLFYQFSFFFFLYLPPPFFFIRLLIIEFKVHSSNPEWSPHL